MNVPSHWHPNQDYCLRCGSFINFWEETFLVPCKCCSSDGVHLVYQQIHYVCLSEIKKEVEAEKFLVEDLFKVLKVELPLK
jgi:hypothetical protein